MKTNIILYIEITIQCNIFIMNIHIIEFLDIYDNYINEDKI